MQTLDACTPLVIEDSTSRVREAQYRWSSSDNSLDAVISTVTGPKIAIRDLTSVQAGKDITIRVIVTDFFGVSSSETAFTVIKRSNPVPKVCYHS
jgi:hypothetical protein